MHGYSKWNEDFYSRVIAGSLLDINKKLKYAKILGLQELEKKCQIAVDSLKRNDDEIFILIRRYRARL